jgi:hypothetical protein
MDPCVWSKLPGEILELVFARLPVGRVRALSKGWSLAGSTCCAFTRACAALQPNLCGIMWRDHSSSAPTYHVRAYDTESCKWLPAFTIHGLPEHLSPATACDAGLVCLASTRPLLPVVLVILNPLTREWRELPPPRLVRKCEAVQLRVDCKTGMYKVLLSGGVVAEEYSSSTNEWSRLLSGVILFLDPVTETPLVHNSATGEVRAYAPSPSSSQGEVLQYKAHMNDLYLLELLPLYEDLRYNTDGHDGCPASRFAVSKYEDGNWTRSAVVYKCELVDIPGETVLFVSGSFLLVVRHSPENDHLIMFCDVKKGKWHELDWSMGTVIPSKDWKNAFSCELRWDACP